MAESVTIIVATYGSDEWELAGDRAADRAAVDHPHVPIVRHHTRIGDLADARNVAASLRPSDWIIFLDADDELEPGYTDVLLAGSGDLRAPAVRYVTAGEDPPPPVTFELRDVRRINPCVIGTMIRRPMFIAARGFRAWPAWEDWELFRRLALAHGGEIVHHPAAVYRVNVNPAGRNSTIADPEVLHRRIVKQHAREFGIRVA